MSKQEKIKEAASMKVWAKLVSMTMTVNDYDIYWKMDSDRQTELRQRDVFEQEVWSYIFELIEKDNRL
jgi:hypothetical protein